MITMANSHSDIGHESLERFDNLATSINDVQYTVSGAERILRGLADTQAGR